VIFKKVFEKFKIIVHKNILLHPIWCPDGSFSCYSHFSLGLGIYGSLESHCFEDFGSCRSAQFNIIGLFLTDGERSSEGYEWEGFNNDWKWCFHLIIRTFWEKMIFPWLSSTASDSATFTVFMHILNFFPWLG